MRIVVSIDPRELLELVEREAATSSHTSVDTGGAGAVQADDFRARSGVYGR